MDDARQWMPYCGPAPPPEAWLTRWNLDPALLLVLALAALLLWRAGPAAGSVRVARPAPHAHPSAHGLSNAWIDGPAAPRRRRALWAAWALTLLLYVSPLCALGSVFFTARVLHHMLLVLVLAPLLAVGLAPGLRRLPLAPWPCTALATAVFWWWHGPAPYAAALASPAVDVLMQLSLLASAVAFWAAARRAAPAVALAALLAATVLMGLLGALVTFAARPLYAPHLASALRWGVAPLEDQQLAGILMWAPGSLVYLAAAVWIGWCWLRAARGGALRAGAA